MKISRKVRVPVFFFKEEGSYVAYSPALDLSSCGRTISEAQRRFASAIHLFLDEIEEMGTTDKVLRELGWRRQNAGRDAWVPPSVLKHTQMEVRMPARA